ncbi:hypothetical protein D1115_06625 [Vibrio alfacsensis]|uniref:Uncharacterized protein n=1 Tax=Vibrio alfacsensis TaxID=1074311 RepID=A0ABN5PFC4_9VIBR|nr:hypothetical protein D1115_06625 [Vibrio alfacsensis]
MRIRNVNLQNVTNCRAASDEMNKFGRTRMRCDVIKAYVHIGMGMGMGINRSESEAIKMLTANSKLAKIKKES